MKAKQQKRRLNAWLKENRLDYSARVVTAQGVVENRGAFTEKGRMCRDTASQS